MSNDVLETISLIMIVDNSVGKTTLMKKFITGKYCDSFAPTLGVELYKKEIEINNKQYLIRIWDTCGQERFRSLSKSYFRNSDGIMLLFDLNSTKSFDNLSSWFNSIKDCGCEDIPMIIVGTKCDLDSSEREVDEEKGNKFAQSLGYKFSETSAKLNININEAFDTLLDEVLLNYKPNLRESVKLSKAQTKKEKKNCC
jgi:small GTP-binding protein